MFLLKRRSDGKYFRNKGYHQDSSWRGENRGANDPRWVKKPSGCIPFGSVSGIKSSRGVAIGSPIRRPAEQSPKEVWDVYWRVNGEWYSKKNAKTRRKWELEKFNEKYEVVEIEYLEVK